MMATKPPEYLKTDAVSKYSTTMSSNQIWHTLNSLLLDAAYPMVNDFPIVEEMLISIIVISTNGKRKLSEEDDPTAYMAYATKLLLSLSTVDKYTVLKDLLERGLERNIIVDYLRKYAVIASAEHKSYSYTVLQLLQLYMLFRSDVALRFFNLTQVLSKRNAFNKNSVGLVASEEEHFHVYLLSLYRAIDKFIPSKGTLASYILLWFENAKGSSSYITYTGEAVTITRGIRRDVHEGKKNIATMGVEYDANVHSTSVDGASMDDGLIGYVARLKKAPLLFLTLALPYDPISHSMKGIKNARNIHG